MIVTFKLVEKRFPGSLFGTIKEQAGTNLPVNVCQWEGLSSSFCEENAAFHNTWSKTWEPVVGDGYLQSFSKVQK